MYFCILKVFIFIIPVLILFFIILFELIFIIAMPSRATVKRKLELFLFTDSLGENISDFLSLKD